MYLMRKKKQDKQQHLDGHNLQQMSTAHEWERNLDDASIRSASSTTNDAVGTINELHKLGNTTAAPDR
jgi:hypothetical protein